MRCGTDHVQVRRVGVLLYLVLLFLVLLVLLAGTASAQDGVGNPTPLPPCPGEGDLGPGTPWPGPDDLSYEYLAHCAHCLRSTPTATSLFDPYLPTATPALLAWRLDCSSSYSFDLDCIGDPPLCTNTFEAEMWDKGVHEAIYAVVFHLESDAPGLVAGPVGWPVPLDPGFANPFVPFFSETMNENEPIEPGVRYCYVVPGYEFVCAQLAPGAVVRLNSSLSDPWLPYSESDRASMLSFYVGADGPGEVWLADVRLAVHDTQSVQCPGDPTDEMFQETCRGQLRFDESGEYGRAYPGLNASEIAYGLLFEVAANDRVITLADWECSFGDITGNSYFTGDLVGVELTGDIYCIGDAGLCARFGPQNYPYTYLARDPFWVEPGKPVCLSFTVEGEGGPEGYPSWLTAIRWIVAREEKIECDYESEETPTPTLTASTPTQESSGGPSLVFTGDWVWSEGVSAEYFNLVLTSPLEVGATWSTLAGSWWSQGTSWEMVTTGGEINQVVLEVTGDVPFNSWYWPPCPALGDWQPRLAGRFGGEYWPTAVLEIPGGYRYTYTFSPDEIVGLGGYGDSYQECPATNASGYTYDWTVKIVSVNGVAAATSTPAATATLLATASPTVMAWSTPTPGPTYDPGLCSDFDWRLDLPVAGFEGDFENLVYQGDCYTLLPVVQVDLSGLPLGIGGSQSLDVPGFALCVNWVRFPAVEMLGLSLSLDWFLLPALAWLVNRILTL